MTARKTQTLSLAVSLLTLIVLACGSSTSTAIVMTATNGANNAAPQNTAAPTTPPKPASKLGDTVEMDGFSLTVTSVDDPCKPSGFYTVKSGNRVIGVNVILANVSSQDKLSVNPLYATLIDSEGFTYQAALGSCDSQVDTVELAKGEKVRGTIGYEIPKDAKPASLKYQTNPLGGSTLQAGLTK